MNSNNNNNISADEDDDEVLIETDRFFHILTIENIQKARKNKAYLKIKNDIGEYTINWSCQQVSSLLNSFPSWILSIKSEGNSITKMIFTDEKQSKNFLKFKLFPNFYMTVRASLQWIVSNCISNKEYTKIYADECGRELKKPKNVYLFYYHYSIDLSNVSNFAIFHCKSAIFYPPELFTNAFNHFCHYLHFQKKITKSSENSFIFDFIKSWIKNPEKEDTTTYENFIESCEGNLILDVTQDHQLLKKYPTINEKGEKLRILSGLFISKDAKRLIDKNVNIISGFLLDSTFRVIPSFVTAILMMSVYNVGIPLAFSFSATECEEIYQRIFDGFKKKLEIDLSKFLFESDQGKSLKAFFVKNKIENIVCIRHLLSNLRKKPFGFQISTIVKCRCQLDLDRSFCHFSNEFQHFLLQYKEQNTNENDTEENKNKKYDEMKKVLNDSLEKVGLCFTDQIEYQKVERWNQVSLFYRIQRAMPSTTNSWESSHGHLNETIPRRHNFFNALTKIIKWSNHKIANFEKLLQKNFIYTNNKMKRKFLSKSSTDMLKECSYYKANMIQCNCGEVSLESSMYKTKMMCSHMIFKCIQNGEKIETIEFPKCPSIKLKYKTRFKSTLDNKMNVEFNYLDGTKQKKDSERDEMLIKHAARTINKYSNCKEKLPQIIEYLNKNLRPKIHEDDIFIGQFPLSFYSTVAGGIYIFSGQIEDIQIENDDSD